MGSKDVHEHYDYGKVSMSFVISFIGAYLTACLVEQLRAHYLSNKKSTWKDSIRWFILMGISMGGICAWCMHVIGLSAVTLENHDNIRMKMHYNIGVNIMSLFIVIFMTTLGMMISSYDPLFMKTKGEILEMFIQDTSQLSMQEIRKMKNTKLLWLISTKSLGFLGLGGFIAGSGIIVMHYTGMAAMHWQGFMTYKPDFVIPSIIVAMVAALLAFWILFRVLSLFPNKEWLRIVSSLMMAIAVCGMHYSGMRAVQWEYSYFEVPDKRFESDYMNKRQLLYPVVGAAMIAAVFIFIIILSDLRRISAKYLQSKLMVADGSSGSEDADTFNARFKVKPNIRTPTNIFQLAQSIVSNDSVNDSINRSISGRLPKIHPSSAQLSDGGDSNKSGTYNRNNRSNKSVGSHSDNETSARRKSSISGRIASNKLNTANNNNATQSPSVMNSIESTALMNTLTQNSTLPTITSVANFSQYPD